MPVAGNQLHRGTMPDGGEAGTTVYINNSELPKTGSSEGKNAASPVRASGCEEAHPQAVSGKPQLSLKIRHQQGGFSRSYARHYFKVLLVKY